MTLARAFWIVAPGQGEIRAERLPEAADGALLLRTLATGISRGTEALVFRGGVPPGQYQAMQCPMMGGAFPFPVKYGYSAVGRSEAGQRLFVLHPHQDIILAPVLSCVPVPDEVPTGRAVLTANMETAVNIVWDATPLVGERILVIGAGVVGLLTASLLARVPGAHVTVTDPNPTRAAPAKTFACAFALPDAIAGEYDLLVHASASEEGLRLALDHAAFEARIIEASWFGTACPALPLGQSFHARRLRLISSQVGAIAGPMRGRRSHRERLALALDLLRDPRFDSLLETATPFAALPRLMPGLLAGGLCHVVTYEDEPCTP